MELDEDGNIATRKLDDGRTLFVLPLLGGRARLGVGNVHVPYSFDASY